jgi:hypothetical protein
MWLLMLSRSERSSLAVLDLIATKQLALRTYAISSNRYKTASQSRLDPNVSREYKLARFSRFVWVVEAINRTLRRAGEPCVLGEAIFDATSSEHLPNCLALHVPGVAWVAQTDGKSRFPITCAPDPYVSGGVGLP